VSARDRFAEVLGERRGAPRERAGLCAPVPEPSPPELSPLERLRAFTSDLADLDDDAKPDHLAKMHGFELVAGKLARGRGHAPVYFLHDGDAGAEPTVRALVVTYPGRRPGAVSRAVLFTFDSEAF